MERVLKTSRKVVISYNLERYFSQPRRQSRASQKIRQQRPYCQDTKDFMGNDSGHILGPNNPDIMFRCHRFISSGHNDSRSKVRLAIRCFNYPSSVYNQCSYIRQRVYERQAIPKVKLSRCKEKCKCYQKR